MLTTVQIPGHGTATVGLDWVELPGLDGRKTEIQQLGRTVDAAWQFVWSLNKTDQEFVAFVSRPQSRSRPVAAGALVHSALTDDTYLAFIQVSEECTWLFGVVGDLPQPGMDMVGDPVAMHMLAKDFLNKQPAASDIPIYTNKPEFFEEWHSPLDVRAFSLEILGHSLQARDYKKARFSRFTTAPVIPMLACALFVAATSCYYLYQMKVEEEALRNAAQILAQATEQKKRELSATVNAAINDLGPIGTTVPAYMEVVGKIEQVIGGWKLTGAECSGAMCTMTFKAQPFATWSSYLAAKPKNWPNPLFDSDITKVIQPLEIPIPEWVPRVLDDLPPRDSVQLELGNLAQRAKAIDLLVTLPSGWKGVVEDSGQVSGENWIPLTGAFNVTGPAVLLRDIAKRLPKTSSVTSVILKIEDSNSFELQGKAYVNP
ncbi:type 4b pilus protein PilO2 [Pseudomonas fulva]|uniref:type 4b pilus protein PilO2 n=1 Tax=Pseudomonas fulva TaxID=47880 RepID=UPI002DBC83EE|nr:type 4b pilus protein PilO2 [Pseudomonas fulva]MEB8059291.1 type 4b pilus protein PilO2 [Pseudomonas fulva]